MTPARLLFAGVEVAVLALALCTLGWRAPAAGTAPVHRLSAPLPETVEEPGPLELRDLVLHPDIEESFPVHSCEQDGLAADDPACDVPPLLT
ncbi:hypothetical protein KGA65_03160 [Ideonella sp. B7]|uniref:hypothetical protein n=1 Tax=Ideonella benzenivorans TaxID=2831643 RepID=UPI001CED8527|nr:hypothetical protein [Ideonella benzenivorans]MCA6215536.1 hypothetical protein [Ideonella benzenivorans]